MANAVASSSREGRPARNRSSMHSLHQFNPHDPGVVVTRALTAGQRPTHVRNDTIKIINQYELKRKVGKGQHGEVYLAEDSIKGYMLAVKCLRRKNKNDRLNKLRRSYQQPLPRSPNSAQLGDTEHKIRKEIAIMKKLNHPHIVRLLEVVDDPLQDKIYMVMEYLGGGEIKWRSRNDNPLLRVDQTRRICRDVILGLEYLHYQGIIHRDIKPANLLWSSDRRTVKITDFGVSTFSYAQRLAAAGKGNIKEDDRDPILMDESDLSKTAGTPMFLAPEIVADVSFTAEQSSSTVHLPHLPSPQQLSRKKPQITKAIDIWAFGVTLYGLLFGVLPFHAKNEFEIYKVIRWQTWEPLETMGLDEIPTCARFRKREGEDTEETEGSLVIDLLERLMEKDAKKRITLDQVKRHPWITFDLDRPDIWIRETTLTKYLQLRPTQAETSTAMVPLRFHWLPKIGRLLTTTLKNVKPQRSF
ncbi:kinase-like domain-containing protein, partial [Epithele typhae]|uniref:kinase-like domain-containing protein n=1 Tax=Epithele typhae TaxID=378194 RepID=UPI002007E643